MACGGRIRTAVLGPRGLCVLASLAAAGCALDSRMLSVSDAGAQAAPAGDGSTASPLDRSAGTWRRQRTAGVPSAADVDGAPPIAGRDADAPEAGTVSETDADVTSPEAGVDAAGPSGPAECHKLVVSSAWIDAISNCLEIQGAMFISTPDGPANAHVDSEPICLQDIPATAAGPSTFGFHLNQASRSAAPADYDASGHGVTGFRFRISDYLSGLPIPFVGVESEGEIYCEPTSGFGRYEFQLSELRARCWESTPGPAPDPTRVRALLFYYPAGWPGESIGMCVDEISAIVQD